MTILVFNSNSESLNLLLQSCTTNIILGDVLAFCQRPIQQTHLLAVHANANVDATMQMNMISIHLHQ